MNCSILKIPYSAYKNMTDIIAFCYSFTDNTSLIVALDNESNDGNIGAIKSRPCSYRILDAVYDIYPDKIKNGSGINMTNLIDVDSLRNSGKLILYGNNTPYSFFGREDINSSFITYNSTDWDEGMWNDITNSSFWGDCSGNEASYEKIIYGALTGVSIASILGITSCLYKKVDWKKYRRRYRNKQRVIKQVNRACR